MKLDASDEENNCKLEDKALKNNAQNNLNTSDGRNLKIQSKNTPNKFK